MCVTDGRKLLVAVRLVTMVASLLQAVEAGLLQSRFHDSLPFARRALVLASGAEKLWRGRQVLAVLGLVVLLPVFAIDGGVVDWLEFRQLWTMDRPLVLTLRVAWFTVTAPQLLVRVGPPHVAKFWVRLVVTPPLTMATRFRTPRKFLARLCLWLLVVNVCDQSPIAFLSARLLQFDGPKVALEYLLVATLLLGALPGVGHLLWYLVAPVAQSLAVKYLVVSVPFPLTVAGAPPLHRKVKLELVAFLLFVLPFATIV